MIIYIALLLYIIFLICKYDFNKCKKGKSIHFYILLVLFILVAGLRYRLGVDTTRYMLAFEGLSTLSNFDLSTINDYKYDPLFLLLILSCKTIYPEFFFFQLVQATLVNVLVLQFFRKHTQKYFVAILLYYVMEYVNYNMEVLRESCAVAIFLWAWGFYAENKKTKFLLCLIPAYLFHTSAIMLFLFALPIIFNIDKKIHIDASLIIVGLVAGVFVSFIIYFILHNMDFILMNPRILEKMDVYQDTETQINALGIISIFLLNIFIPFWCLIRGPKIKEYNQLEYTLIFGAFLSLLCIPIYIFTRYNNYFFPFIIIAVVNLISISKIRIHSNFYIKPTIFTCIFLFSPYFVNQLLIMSSSVEGSKYKNYQRYIPYSSVFDETEDPDREKLFSLKNSF